MVVARQVARDRLSFEVAVDGLVSAVSVLEMMLVLQSL